MEKNNLQPHVHSELIKAWADGHKIEVYDRIYSQNWVIEEHPQWRIHSQYRIYDPLREVKGAYKNGFTIEQYNPDTLQIVLSYNIEDYKKYIKTKEGPTRFSPSWNNNWGWRIKPQDFNVGDLIKEIKSDGVYRIVEKEEDVDRFHLQLSYIENDNYSFKKATKQEVLNAPNYDGTATNKDFLFEEGDWIINRAAKETEVVKFNELTFFSFIGGNHKEIHKYKWYYATKEEIFNSSNIKIEKEKPKEYIPFTWEDREQLRGKWIKHKKFEDEELIISLTANEDDWLVKHDTILNGENLLNNYLFLDGSPCGKLKK